MTRKGGSCSLRGVESLDDLIALGVFTQVLQCSKFAVGVVPCILAVPYVIWKVSQASRECVDV